MKLEMGMVLMLVVGAGCANLNQPGGAMGTLQGADDALAAKYGVPARGTHATPAAEAVK